MKITLFYLPRIKPFQKFHYSRNPFNQGSRKMTDLNRTYPNRRRIHLLDYVYDDLCDGLPWQPMNSTVSYSFQRSLLSMHRPRRYESMVSLGVKGVRAKNIDLERRRQPPFLPTAPSRTFYAPFPVFSKAGLCMLEMLTLSVLSSTMANQKLKKNSTF